MRTGLIGAVVGLLLCSCGSSAEVLAQGEDAPFAVAADANGVYWLNAGEADPGNAALRSRPKGSAQATTLASGFAKGRALVASGGNLFWVSTDGTVRMMSAAGGPMLTLATEPAPFVPFALTVLQDKVYWLSNYIPPPPATPTDPATPPQATLAMVPVGGGERTVVTTFTGFSTDRTYADQITNDGTTLYWCTGDGGLQYLDPAAAVQSILKRQNQLAGVVILGSTAFYVQFFVDTQTLNRKKLGTLDLPQVVGVLPTTSSIATDGASLFLGGPTSVSISRVSLTDGSLSTLYSTDLGASAVAFWGGAVYGAMRDGRVVKVAP